MKCAICKTGMTHPGTVTVTLERDGTVIVVKDVPADICDNCGEYYLDETVARRVYQQAQGAAGPDREVEILRYAA
ncbi:MAG: hypothetical protein Tsb0016_20800 [Sphingomonadales bacterium]